MLKTILPDITNSLHFSPPDRIKPSNLAGTCAFQAACGLRVPVPAI